MIQQVNKQRVRHSFGKRLFSYRQHAVVQTAMAENLTWQLYGMFPDGFDRVLEVGCGSGVLTAAFLKRFQVNTFYANDLVGKCRHEVAAILNQYPGSDFDFLSGDIEQIQVLPQHLDAVISNATFQWLTNLPEFLPRLKHHLRPKGVVAFSTFGPENLREIRKLTGVSLHYLAYSELRKLLAQHFDVLWCEESIEPLHFPSPRAVLRHIRLTGVNGVATRPWTKSRLQEFETQYWQQFNEWGDVSLTYHPILCIVRA
jgi:malonyl-CoA O-methyltransferase